MMKEIQLLFRSRARVRILLRLLLHSGTDHYQRELARATDLPVRAVQREVATLTGIGLVSSRLRGRRRYYQVVVGHPFYRELKALFVKVGLVGPRLGSAARWKNGVRAAFLFGSFATGEEQPGSDVDLLVVGSIDEEKLDEILAEAPIRGERELNPMLYTEESFRHELAKGDPFLRRVLGGPKIFLIGDEAVLERLGPSRKA